MLTLDRLKALLAYEPDSGRLIWLAKSSPKSSKIVVGAQAGAFDGRYWQIAVDGHRYLVHRVAWLLSYGVWPTNQIDHINGNTSDNRLVNLRDATPSMNQQNQRKAQSRSKSGLLGVVTLPDGRFRAQIWVRGTSINLGTFATAQQAHDRYIRRKRDMHQGCAI